VTEDPSLSELRIVVEVDFSIADNYFPFRSLCERIYFLFTRCEHDAHTQEECTREYQESAVLGSEELVELLDDLFALFVRSRAGKEAEGGGQEGALLIGDTLHYVDRLLEDQLRSGCGHVLDGGTAWSSKED
jgi:hypothetical protein